MNYDKFCSQILDAEAKIRFATVYDEWGVRVGGGMRPGMTSMLTERAEKELVSICALDWKARKDLAKWLGKTKYTLAEYDTVKRFSFYLGHDHLLLVSTEKDCSTHEVTDKIINLYYENQ